MGLGELGKALLDGDACGLLGEVDGCGLHLGHDVLHELFGNDDAVFGLEGEEV